MKENKEMIIYLNKNIKENNNIPVKARINYSTMNFQNNYYENDTFKPDLLEQNSKLLSKSKKQESLISSKISNLSDSQNSLGKNNEHKFGQSYSSFKQINISNDNFNDVIKPVTNYTGYKYMEEKGGVSNNHFNNIRNSIQTERKNNIKNNSMKPVRGNNISILDYKYGKDSNNISNNNNYRNKFSMNNSQNNKYN